MPNDSKTQVSIKIPTSLYDSLVKAVTTGKYPNQTAGIIAALEHDLNETMTDEMSQLKKTIQKQASDITEKDQAIQKLVSNMSQSETAFEGLKNMCQEKDTRITDLQEQLKIKDTQIEKLTETMQAQAVHLQTLLNQKAIEAPGSKKPWWRFW
jgi:septal ring factor EnvC (AmiA/AmiB activator)